jgi:hypothetical protein
MAAGETDVSAVSYGRLIGLDTQTASPPTSAYIAVDDVLQIFIQSRVATPVLKILVRILLPDGTIVPNDFSYSPANATLGVNIFQSLPEGFLLSIGAYDANATQPGQTWVKIALRRGTQTVGVLSQVLLAGYVTFDNALGWPNSPLWPKSYGAGNIRVVVGTAPGAGNEVTETVPSGVRWRLVSVFIVFGASAVAGNRIPFFIFDDGSNQYSFTDLPVFTASLAANITLAAGYTESADAGNGVWKYSGIINHFMPTGFRFRTHTVGWQAGDAYNAPIYLVEEWLS